MTENKVSKVLAYISAALSGIFILTAAYVIIFLQKKYAGLWGVPVNNIEAIGTVIPYGAAAYIILALALIIISVRVIMKKYTNADAIVTAVLWGVMWLGAFAAGSIQVHYARKNGFDGYLVLVTLQQIISMCAALLVPAAVMAVSAADCAAFVYNRRKLGKCLPKAAIAISAVYIFATLLIMLLVRDKPTIVIGVVVLWLSAAAAIIAAAAVMSGKGGLVPLVVCLVLFAAALGALPVCNTIQSRIIAVTVGSEALAGYNIVSGYCGFLNTVLYVGVALAVCAAARNVYNDKDTSSERIE